MQRCLKEIIIDKSVRCLCFRPYPNHPKGCPNYGKRKTCPPAVKMVDEIFDISKGFWFVWVDFDFTKHCGKMRIKHPNWTQRQIECCLYWQGKANKMLREEVEKVAQQLGKKWKVSYCPEAMGVNVTATMRCLGVELEWPPVKIVRKIAMFGIKNDSALD